MKEMFFFEMAASKIVVKPAETIELNLVCYWWQQYSRDDVQLFCAILDELEEIEYMDVIGVFDSRYGREFYLLDPTRPSRAQSTYITKD